MKLKLICDVDIDISIEDLSNYLIKLGYTEKEFPNKNIRRFEKINDDNDFLSINIPSRRELSDYERSFNLALELICINEDKTVPAIIKEITNKDLNKYKHTVLKTELLL